MFVLTDDPENPVAFNNITEDEIMHNTPDNIILHNIDTISAEQPQSADISSNPLVTIKDVSSNPYVAIKAGQADSIYLNQPTVIQEDHISLNQPADIQDQTADVRRNATDTSRRKSNHRQRNDRYYKQTVNFFSVYKFRIYLKSMKNKKSVPKFGLFMDDYFQDFGPMMEIPGDYKELFINGVQFDEESSTSSDTELCIVDNIFVKDDVFEESLELVKKYGMSMNLDDNGWATIPNMFQIIRLYGNQEPVNLISTSASKGNVSANYGANMSFVSEDTGTNIPSVQITRVQALPSYEFPQTSHNPRDPNQYGRQSAINEMTNQPIASPLILNHPPEHGNQQLFVGSPRFQDPRNLSSFGM